MKSCVLVLAALTAMMTGCVLEQVIAVAPYVNTFTTTVTSVVEWLGTLK